MADDTRSPAIPGSIIDTMEHIERLDAKRARLKVAIEDSYEQFTHSVTRASNNLTRSQAVQIYEWTRTLHSVRSPVGRLAAAFDVSIQKLHAWARDPDPDEGDGPTIYTGVFPVENQRTPIKDSPCVYALWADRVLIYVGQSRNVRTRIKTHWSRRDEKPGLDGWTIWRCASRSDAERREVELIERHNPRHNRLGNRFYGVA